MAVPLDRLHKNVTTAMPPLAEQQESALRQAVAAEVAARADNPEQHATLAWAVELWRIVYGATFWEAAAVLDDALAAHHSRRRGGTIDTAGARRPLSTQRGLPQWPISTRH